jgi:tetratricopeptide (TPR) repeat protein
MSKNKKLKVVAEEVGEDVSAVQGSTSASSIGGSERLTKNRPAEIRPRKKRTDRVILLTLSCFAVVALPLTHSGKYGFASAEAEAASKPTTTAPTSLPARTTPLSFPSGSTRTPGSAAAAVTPPPTGLPADVAGLRSSVVKFRAKKNYAGLGEALAALSQTLLIQGKPGAKPLIIELIDVRTTKAKDPLKLAAAQHLLGWFELMQGDKAQASPPLRLAAASRESLKAPVGDTLFTLQLLVWAEREAGQMDAAITQAQKLVKLERSVGERLQLGNALDALGLTYIMSGRPADALPVLDEAVAAHEVGPPAALATSSYYLGWAILSAGKLPEDRAQAAPPLQRALKLKTAAKASEADVAQVLVLLGWAEREGKNYPEAVSAQKRVLAFNRASKGALIAPLEALATTYVLSDDAVSAVPLFTESLSLQGTPTDIPSRTSIAKTGYLLGWAQYSAKDLPGAKKSLEAAFVIQDELKLVEDSDKTIAILKEIK